LHIDSTRRPLYHIKSPRPSRVGVASYDVARATVGDKQVNTFISETIQPILIIRHSSELYLHYLQFI